MGQVNDILWLTNERFSELNKHVAKAWVSSKAWESMGHLPLAQLKQKKKYERTIKEVTVLAQTDETKTKKEFPLS